MSNTQKENVPELRFPAFEGEWEEKKLGEVGTFTSGGTPLKSKSEYWNGDIPWITTGDIHNIKRENITNFITEKGLNESSAKLITNEAILIAMYGQGKTRGMSAILNFEATTNQACAIYQTNQNINFVFQYFQKLYEFLRSLSNEGSQKNLSLSLLKEITLNYPNEQEQKKIGDFFSKLDRQIELEEQKLELLQQQKKCYMQKIFLQELRFKDENGNDYPEWVVKLIGDIGKVAMNKRIYKHETSANEEIPFYKIGNFGKKADTFISREQFNEYKEKYPYPKKGDILISASGSIGKTIEYKGEEAYYQDSNIVWLDHNEEVLNIFLKYFYILVKWNGVEGTTIKRLYNKNILNTKIDLPTISEQQKIGNFFCYIDNLIEIQEQKLEFLKQRKQSLLQKMFV
ncbi:putative restriction and modification system specificity protein [Staphylococcus aureus]|uniref:restriction endonuclease subunit S n=1 Tax=Staphylococcus aureus TaxID=1280 RepID=UPI000DA34F94|nr:restriction endonuclease subunit S [Staphylococcus aureus]SQE41189.1 putative restriction and modification system specificity protein [Staphylococcus aureus]